MFMWNKEQDVLILVTMTCFHFVNWSKSGIRSFNGDLSIIFLSTTDFYLHFKGLNLKLLLVIQAPDCVEPAWEWPFSFQAQLCTSKVH